MQQRVTEPQAAQRAQLRGQIDGLTAQRGELQAQLRQLTERRTLLYAQARRESDPTKRGELESRMAELDARSSQLDERIMRLNDQISDGLGRLAQTSNAPVPVTSVPRVVQAPRIEIPNIVVPPISGRRAADMRQVGAMMFGEAVILALIGLTFWRFGMRRMREQFERMFSVQHQQLTQLQQAVDTVAIEVERISEGQRYVAKVLSEATPDVAIAAGRKDAVSPRRDG